MLKHITHSLYALLLVCLCAACGSSDDAPVQESVPVQVGFTLTTGDSYASRALPGENGTTEGVGYENYIDIVNRDFRFYIFDEDNKFVDELNVLLVIPMDNSAYPSTYYVTAELTQMPPETFKVVVAANWDRYPTLTEGETTIEDVCKASEYDYKQPFVPSASQKIPMYGIKTCTGMTFTPNLSTDLGEIDMLRAMAKVKVKLADGMTGHTLSDAQVNRFAGKGMAAPLTIYDNTSDDCKDWEAGMNVSTTINTSSTPFPIIDSEDGGRVIYLPEYKNTDATYPTSFITVTLDDNTNYDIYFRNYVDGKPTDDQIDIVRNHYYTFTINKVGAGITVEYEVADWEHNEENHHWEQKYSYPTYENVVPWSYIEENIDWTKKVDTRPTMYYVASNWEKNENNEYVLTEGDIKGAFEVGFRMTGPDNQKWKPAIHGSETDYAIRVYKREANGTLMHLPSSDDWVANDCWYKIQLIPKDADKVGTEFDFGITTTLTSINQTMFLLINGEDAQTLKWTYGGTDARIIKVVQVSQPSSENAENEDNT